jgi:hypothetical protein
MYSSPVTANDAAATARVAAVQPTLRTGTEALTAAALAWLAP